MLPMRLDPATLPPAGKVSVHDSAHEDYRFISASRDPSPNRKRLQTSEWTTPSPSYKPSPECNIRGCSSPTRDAPHNKPDHFNINDITGASPSASPGLTVCTTAMDTSWLSPYSSSSCMGVSARSVSCSPSRCLSPTRMTNPLSPTYQWQGTIRQGGMGAHPVAKPMHEPGEWRLHVPVRTRALDIHDIPGSQSTSPTRQPRRGDCSDPTYADAARVSTSPVRDRMLHHGRPVPPPVDVRPLGMWGSCGDTGNMLTGHTARRAGVRAEKSYELGVSATATHQGQHQAPPPTLLRSSTTPVPAPAGQLQSGSEQHSVHAHQATPLVVKSNSTGLADAMLVLGLNCNQSLRSPQRMGHAKNFSSLHQRRPNEVHPYM